MGMVEEHVQKNKQECSRGTTRSQKRVTSAVKKIRVTSAVKKIRVTIKYINQNVRGSRPKYKNEGHGQGQEKGHDQRDNPRMIEGLFEGHDQRDNAGILWRVTTKGIIKE